MANFLCIFLFRILLPILISTCIIFRPTALSAIYLLLLFYLPFVPVPTETTMSGHTGIYLKILIAVSVLTALGQITFQIVLAAMPLYADFLQNDEFLEKILRHVGFIRLNHVDPVAAVLWLSPEVLMLAISIGFFITMHKLNAPNPVVALNEAGSTTTTPTLPKSNTKYISYFVTAGRYCVLIALCSAAVLRPSVIGGLYFLIFLSSATWWACYKQLRRGFAIFLRCLLPVVFIHLSATYAYQFEWPQEFLEKNSTYARYFGLRPLVIYRPPNNTTDKGPGRFSYADEEWASYVNPLSLYLLFYLLVLESRGLLKPESQKKQGPFSRLEGSFSGQLGRQMSQRMSRRQLMRSATTKQRWRSATRKVREAVAKNRQQDTLGETTPLIQGVSPSKRYGSSKKSGILQDSTGSVTVTGENTEDIPLDDLGKGTVEDDYKPTVFENVIFAMESVLQLIIRSSYIGTNIIMMAWSITYLSWITFVLLIWANLIWLIPNQRKSMLYSSPFLVVYALFLLLSAYIYSMDLTEEELPTVVDGVNLSEIGFVRVKILPCVSLYIKCLYTIMFWVTLRQYMQERLEERQTSALADMVAPLQVTVGTATGVNKEQEKGSKIMEKIGFYIKRFLTKFWIWIVAITLFAVAITGQRMTGFRIIYMALFLFFILSFQFSFRVWRKMMFSFWLVVIIFSMVNLVLVYTYQFKNFETYWRDYLHIPIEQQLDIGLEKFEIKQLFVRLVIPTFFVIITVIQLHYFHKDFMELSDPKNTSILREHVVENEELDQSSLQGGAALERSEMDDTTTTSAKFDLYELGNMSSTQVQRLAENWLKRLVRVKNLLYLFMELHMIKVVLLFAMLICVYDTCALYIVIIVFISLACTFGRPMQLVSIYMSSLLVSVLLLARMVYQIKYITPENWNVTCELKNGINITNNARWLGFDKTDAIPRLVKWNITFILIVTLWSVILIRQHYYRISRGRPTTRAFFMFPKVTRTDADKDLKTCVKYLANYGFYKFGVEISLIATVTLIGIRMDMYAVFYAIWLCVLFPMKRRTLAKVWVFYLAFIAFALPIQYFMVVGLPPTLCQEYPWQSFGPVQDWAYLVDPNSPPPVKKLICDFILLLIVSRQWVVFRIERRYAGSNYAGGSNESIIHHAEEKDFKVPVPDFITYVRSYLDIIKRGLLQSFLWITLAIVFLAGTNRVNIFSIGYLIGAFVFLWHGSDLYLRPIPKILKQWQWLLGYNVAVIFLKTSFQIVGCLYIKDIPSNCCWLVQLLGIGCVRKFGDLGFAPTGLYSSSSGGSCKVPREFIGIAWDGLCFGLLIMQRRIFNSYNFFHIVDETKATTILASRGAELIEEMRLKRMKEQEETEFRVLEKIKHKMDRIKANQQKIQKAGLIEKTSHTIDRPPLARSTSASSCTSATSQSSPAGYHTPIDEEEPAPLTPRSSLIQPQAPPSPYSAVMTVSLEGYLEPQKLSISSPPNSELNPRPASPDDSFPVFSPPPYDEAPPYADAVSEPRMTVQRRQGSIGPPWMQGSFVTPRQSVISYSSRSPLSHHECNSILSIDVFLSCST